ncbi:hypothetical protein [Halomonas sp. hl-4]|uniref:hypothetical protein n=1 Tax=Halomonas sp. hl-4 TaxID=1761789 RepID=UPI000BB800CF|nr:hypothetical protein [Halomonas sp. hl-4]SNY96881.1 hypothetical protein SAMN04488142_1440 [Halomonas sp. hl-4]
MVRTTRIEPISEEQAEAIIISGWRVIDVTQPEAIEVARRFKTKTSNKPGADPDATQDYDASQTNVGKGDE